MNGGKRARPWQDDLSRVGLTLEEILPRPPYRGAVEASIIVLAAEVADFRRQRMLVIDSGPIDPSTLPNIVESVRNLCNDVQAQHEPTRRPSPQE
jgi:hypothetical protein